MVKIAPWHSDVVQRPVKFVRGGGFIVVTTGADQYFVTGDKVTRISLPGEIENGTGCSFHNGVCVIVGQRTRMDDSGHWTETVYLTSKDGKSWSITHTFDDTEADCRGGPIVWSKDAFYASVAIRPFDSEASEYEISSKDGMLWSDRSGGDTAFGEESGYRSPFPKKHCTHNKCTDVWDQNVPDGFIEQVRDAPRPVAAPENPPPMGYSQGMIRFQTDAFIPSSMIIDADGKALPTPLSQVYCIAAQGAWLAGGLAGDWGGLALSTNSGAKWGIIADDLDGIPTGIVAVPFSGAR